jgi:hypothetical protein
LVITQISSLGDNAGNNAASANNSNFLGLQAGSQATFASNSNFLGQNAGSGAKTQETQISWFKL